MSPRQLRRQRGVSLPHTVYFMNNGRAWAIGTSPGLGAERLQREWSEAQTLAAEARHGVRWPWLDVNALVRELRSPCGYRGVVGRFGRAQGLLTDDGSPTRKGYEVLYYLTRVYI